MAVETELKLRITPDQMAKLRRHTLIKSHSVSRPVTRRLQNIYYDTDKLELHRAEMALRLRHVGRQWLQTLKGGGSVKGSLHRRNEWEIPVGRAALDFSASPQVDWDKHLPPSLRKKLHPVFVTDFSRSSRMLQWHDAQIELCMDQGEVRAAQHSMPFCELELELKSGEPQQLFELALAILEIVPFELETVSKAEQGYRLLSGYTMHPVKGVAPVFARTDTLTDVMKALTWSCLQHFQDNLSGAMDGSVDGGDETDEYLHQMRVALRRLRVVLRMTEKIRADERLAELGKTVSDLCIALGRVREWDVFIAQMVQPMCTRMPQQRDLQALLATSEQHRAASYKALRETAQARAIQRLLMHFSIWMNGPYWQHAAKFMPQAQDFATRRLHKLAKRFAQSAQQLNTGGAVQLHALRILAKKLRYSAEFFTAWYDKRKAGAYLAVLGEVQEVLGQINDIAVAHRLLDELTADAALAAHLEAVTLARGWIAHDLSHQLAVLRETMQRFNKQRAFWEK